MTALLLACIGLLLSKQLPTSLYPVISKPRVQITILFEGGLEQFKNYWGEKVEHSLMSINQVDQVTAEYRLGRARFYVDFSWHVPTDKAITDISVITSFYQSQFPRTTPPIRVEFSDPSSESYLAIKPKNTDLSSLRAHINSSVIPKLKDIEGVSNAWLSDYGQERVLIKLNPLKLLEYKVEIKHIIKILDKMEYDVSPGSITTESSGTFNTIYASGFDELDDISNLVVSSMEYETVKIKDIADISIEPTISNRFFQLGDEDVLALAIWPKPGEDLHHIASSFIRITSEILKGKADVFILNNPARFINKTLETVFLSIFIGLCISAFVVMTIMKRFGLASLICSVMPLSLLMSLIFMYFADVNFNMLSLAAIGISVGIVVDGAIVVVESIIRRVRNSKSVLEVEDIVDAVNEVKYSLFASTFTTVVVFLPLAFTAPMASALLKDISLVIVSIVLISLLINLFVVPSLYLVFINKNISYTNPSILTEWAENSIIRYFRKVLILRHSVKLSLLFTSCLVVLSIWVISNDLKRELIATPQAEIVDVHLTFSEEGLPLISRQQLLNPVKNKIESVLGDLAKYLYIDYRLNDAYISVHIKNHSVLNEVLEKLRRELVSTERYTLDISPWVTSSMSIPNIPDIQILVSGNNEKLRREYVAAIKNYFSDSEQVKRIKSYPSSRESITATITHDSYLLGKLFPNETRSDLHDELNLYVGLAMEEEKLFDIETENGPSAVLLQLGELVKTQAELSNLPIFMHGKEFMARDLIDVELRNRWRDYFTRNGSEQFMVEVWLSHNDFSAQKQLEEGLVNQLNLEFKTEILPLTFGEPYFEVNQSLTSISMALALAFVSVFICILFMYNNFLYAIVATSTIPLSCIGVALGLYVFESTLSLNSLLGMIILCGLAVNNSILFIDCLKNVNDDISYFEAVEIAIRRRFKSIIVSSLTTILGMLPIAVGHGAGGKILQPIGLTIIFGLMVSTILFFLILPLVLTRVNDLFLKKMSVSTPYRSKNILLKEHTDES